MNSLISSGAESSDNFQNSTFLLKINPKLAGTPCIIEKKELLTSIGFLLLNEFTKVIIMRF